MKKLIESLNQMDINSLCDYCLINFEDKGLFLLNYLIQRFDREGDEEIASIVDALLNTVACYWEGADLYKLYFYESVLSKNPESKNYLANILNFGLPPYYGSMNDLFDFQKYKETLFNLDPQNSIFKELEKYSSYDRNGNPI
ncbi:hypothetical protein [Flectobacillus roseus]|uniref:Immunity protein 30 domain-containing protein n=1 Tax=Flectobacillus roseus TaxID=502259 RepID=A0ABT6YG61_9BACT|nr:hypothetical protein [Flectobacillus roseus]MDI9862510.1 hypothetical protein [Flectobacillus roseus]